MTKYRPYSRREFRRLLGLWARRNLKVILVLTAGAIGLLALETFLLTVVGTPNAFSWWLLGALQATVATVYLHALHVTFLANEREAIWQLRGAWGEENTRSELQRARRKRLIWGWVDSINLQAGDLDHLVVTRQGGLVAVDSKWRNQATDTVDMARAASKARLRAEALAQTLLKSDRSARHRAKINPLQVTPVVVLWGAGQDDVPEGTRIDDIEFVSGRRFVAWLSNLEGEPVTEAAAADVVKRLAGFRAATWDNTKTTVR